VDASDALPLSVTRLEFLTRQTEQGRAQLCVVMGSRTAGEPV